MILVDENDFDYSLKRHGFVLILGQRHKKIRNL